MTRSKVGPALLALAIAATLARPAAAQNDPWGRRLAADRAAKAAELARRGDTALALAAYADALRHDETYGAAWVGFGQLREALGDTVQAEAAYTRAAALPDSRSAGLEARAALRTRAGRHDDALADLQAATDLAPTPERLALLGKRFAERRAWSAALATWRRLLGLLAPSSAEAARARLEISALGVLAAETDPVTSGARGRGWVRAALAKIAARTTRKP